MVICSITPYLVLLQHGLNLCNEFSQLTMSFFVPLLGLFKGPGLKVLFNPKVHGLSAALNGKYHIMVYTQLADRENKLTAARKLIKYYMSFKCVS